jgi:hypothetical protein
MKNYFYLDSRFGAGAVVVYDSCGYERYDSCSLFRFYAKGPFTQKANELIWNLPEDEPDSKINEYFQAVSAAY